MIAFDQTKPLLKAFASAGVDTKKLYFVAGLSNRFERMYMNVMLAVST